MEPKLLTASRFIDPETGCSYRYVYSETEYFRPHYHDYYEIFMILEGTVLHKVNGAEFPLSRGSLVLIRPSDCHNYICQPDSSFSMLNFTFTKETADTLFSYLGEGFPSRSLLESPLPPEVDLTDAELEWICKRMDSTRAIDPKNYIRRKTSLRILLFEILTQHFYDYQDISLQMPLWLEELCAKVKENGNFTQGTQYFFSLTTKSREHVSRCIKKYTGMTVSQYINSLRLNYIANMLRSSNHSITELIFSSGFNNISWATELFKDKYGMTMRDYRNSFKHPAEPL